MAPGNGMVDEASFTVVNEQPDRARDEYAKLRVLSTALWAVHEFMT
jgi:hypothetical protein